MRVLVLAAALALQACTSVAVKTAGEIGCPTSEVVVRDGRWENIGLSSSWTAECRGKTFVCTDRFSGTRCRETLTKSASGGQRPAPSPQ